MINYRTYDFLTLDLLICPLSVHLYIFCPLLFLSDFIINFSEGLEYRSEIQEVDRIFCPPLIFCPPINFTFMK